jgi:hypothetical protein
MGSASVLESLVGHVIVFDLTSRFVILGTYRGTDGPHYIVENADVHDLRDATTTRDLYVIDAKRHGVNCNRQRVLVRCDGVVGISRLEDVIE